MRKILFLEQFPNISGGQRVLLNILEGLDRSRYVPYIGIPEEGELSAELEKINVKYFLFPIGFYSPGRKSLFDIISYLMRAIFLVPLCISVIRRYKIDLVYANAPRTFLWAILAVKLMGVPIIWHLHSILKGPELKLVRFAARLGVKKIIAVSRAAAATVEGLGVPVEVVYNGVDVLSEARQRTTAKVVGYVGQLARWKGVEDFILAAEKVIAKVPDSRFWVIGDVLFGGGKEKSYKESLLSTVRDKGYEDKILFLGKRSDVPELLNKMSCLVIPSIEPDPCPLIMLEAMAAAIPVVAANHGGPAEIIENNVTGILYPPGDVDALAEVLGQLLNDTARCRSLGEKGRQAVAKHYNHEIFIGKIRKIIGEVI